MKKVLCIQLIFIITAQIQIYCQNFNWHTIKGPEGAQINDMALSERGNLYSCTNGAGLFVYSNSDSSWGNMFINSADKYITSVYVNKNEVIYFGTSKGYFYTSSDTDGNWQKLYETPGNTDIVCINQNSKGDLFFGTYSDGIFRSQDDGQNWLRIRDSLAGHYIKDIQITKNDEIFVCTTDGISFSKDDGDHWVTISTFRCTSNLLIVDSLLIIGSTISDIMISDNYGQQWNEYSGSLPYQDVTVLAINDNNDIFTGMSGKGIYKSEDFGKNWSKLNDSDAKFNITAMFLDSLNNFYIGTKYNGVFYVNNDDFTWSAMNKGFFNVNVNKIFSSGNNIFAGCENVGFFAYDIDNQLWEQRNNGLSNLSVEEIAQDSKGNLYIGTWGGGIYRSTDQGLNWTSKNNGLPNNYILSIGINHNDDIYCGVSSEGFYKFSEDVESWNEISSRSVYSMAFNDTGYIYIGVPGKGVYKSCDNGQTWEEKNNRLFNYTIRTIEINHRGDIYVGTNAGVYFSNNGGNSWTSIDLGLPYQLTDRYINAISTDNNNDVYIGTYIHGVLFIRDNSDTCISVNKGLLDKRTTSLCFDNLGKLYVSTVDMGIFQLVDNEVGVDNNEKINSDFSICYNFPNPFNCKTTIFFNLDKSQRCIVNIYNINGRLIDTKSGLYKGGTNYLFWDASTFSSGLYFYRIKTEEKQMMNKCILIK